MNVGLSELILIVIIALLLNPRDLPKAARYLGRTIRWFKDFSRRLKAETGLDELEQEFKGIHTDLQNIGKEVQQTVAEPAIHQEPHLGPNDIRQNVPPAPEQTAADIGDTIPPDLRDAKPVKKSLGFKEFKLRKGYEKPAPQPETESGVENDGNDENVS